MFCHKPEALNAAATKLSERIVNLVPEWEMTAAKMMLFTVSRFTRRLCATEFLIVKPLLSWSIGAVPLPSALSRLSNRTTEQARVPIRQLHLPDYPAAVVKRFPELIEHRRREMKAITDWIESLNTGRETQP